MKKIIFFTMMKSIIIFIILFLNTCFTLLKAQDNNKIDVKFYPAIGKSKDIAVLMFGGAEGGYPSSDFETYTKAGYPYMEVAYFGTVNTPKQLEMIPLEYFEKVIEYYKSMTEIQGKKIVVYGGSKGGELALLLASRYSEIQGVIAVVPSHVVFQGIGGLQSSWSYKGKPIPFVPYADYDFSKIKNYECLELYQLSLKNEKAVDEAIIHVENINGPVLLFSGKDDKMWPSSQMVEMIIQRLKKYDFKFDYKYYVFENAGHTLNENFMIGGTIDGNKTARIERQKLVLEFLDKLATKK